MTRHRSRKDGNHNEIVEIGLPWPSKDLSPNARVHWSKKSEASAAERALACLVTKAAGWHRMELPEGRLHLWVTFHPPTRRMPDDDNMLARFKPSRDGIADALGIDDKRFVSHPFVSDKPVKHGEVRVRISGSPESGPIAQRGMV